MSPRTLCLGDGRKGHVPREVGTSGGRAGCGTTGLSVLRVLGVQPVSQGPMGSEKQPTAGPWTG